VIDAIGGWHWPQIKRIDPIKAGNVIAVLLGIGTPLMVRIDAAIGAEVMPRRSSVELV
jgi:hypothetical protein